MGLFTKADPAPAEPAPKSIQRQLLPFAILALLIATLLFTGYVAVTVAGILAHEYRRVRARWYLVWAAVTGFVALLAAQSATAWAGWVLAQLGHFMPRLLPHDPTNTDSALTVAAAFADRSLASAFAAELIAAAPLAMLTCALVVRYRSHARAERGTIEGERFSNVRPVGTLDRMRITRERAKVAAGHYLPAPPTPATVDQLLADLHALQTETTTAAPTATATASTTGRESAAPQPDSPPPTPAPTAPAVDPADPFALPAQHTIRRTSHEQ